MPESVQILVAAAFTLAACIALGHSALAWLRISCSRGEHWAMSLLAGAALFSTAILALGLAGGANRIVLMSAGLAALATPLFTSALVTSRSPRNWLLAGATVAYGFVYFIHAWSPEISPDGMAYHVALPAQYLRDGRIAFLPANIYAQLSQAMEMLYLHAFAFGKHSATALVHLAFLFALLALMSTYALRNGIPATAGVLVLASPVVGIDAASAYNDVALAATLFSLFWMMERWREEDSDRLLWVAGLMAGLAFAIKYTAFLALPYAIFCLGRRATAKRIFTLTAAAALITGPWLLKNIAFIGNPVAPFASAWFPNPVLDPLLESEYRGYLGFDGTQLRSEIPHAVFVGGFALGGLLGPVFWLSPVALFSRWRLVLPAILFMAPFAANLSTRFLIPGLPFVALGMAQVLSRIRGLWIVVAIIHLVLGWYPVTHAFADIYAWHIKELPWRAALRIESEAEYMSRKVVEYPIFAAVARSPGRVLAYAQFADSYAGTEVINGTMARPGVEMREMVWRACFSTLPREGWQFWFPQQRLTGIRAGERTFGSQSLMVSELRLYHLMTQFLPPNAQIGTSPPSNEARFIVDGNPATRWRGDQDPGRLGVVEVTWQEPVLLSRLQLEGAPPVTVDLEGRAEDGQWRPLAVKPERTWFAPQDLRRLATRALRDQGVRSLVLNEADFGRAEMLADPAGWGVKFVASGGRQWLFDIVD